MQIEMLVEQYPGFIVPVNMFALDLRGLGGVIRRQNTTETEAEPWVFHRVLYNLQQVDTANNIFLKNICCLSAGHPDHVRAEPDAGARGHRHPGDGV